MANVNITNAIKSSESRASIDSKYGPYASVAAAHAALGEEGADVVAVGLTVGIIDSVTQTVVEYWYQGGTTQAHLVPKGGGSGTTDYNDLANKPTVNGVTLSGSKSVSDLGLATAAQGAKADTAYQKPGGGIPKTDLESAVQTSLGKADTALQNPSGTDGQIMEKDSSAAGGVKWSPKPSSRPTHVGHTGATPASFEVEGGEYHSFENDLDTLGFSLGSGNRYEESYIEFTTSANWTDGSITWPQNIRFAPQEPMFAASKSYLMTVINGIVTAVEVV